MPDQSEMPEQTTPFIDAIRRFYEGGIRFVIVGGVAMHLHGSTYPTLDVNFAYATESDNLEALASFLPTIHARLPGRPASDELVITPATLRVVRFLNLYTNRGGVDVMRRLPEVDSFEGLW